MKNMRTEGLSDRAKEQNNKTQKRMYDTVKLCADWAAVAVENGVIHHDKYLFGDGTVVEIKIDVHRPMNKSYSEIEGEIEKKILYGESLEEHLKSTFNADVKEAIKKHQYAPSKGKDDVCHICGHGPEHHENFIYDR